MKTIAIILLSCSTVLVSCGPNANTETVATPAADSTKVDSTVVVVDSVKVIADTVAVK